VSQGTPKSGPVPQAQALAPRQRAAAAAGRKPTLKLEADRRVTGSFLTGSAHH
jgi:hypothetical protein